MKNTTGIQELTDIINILKERRQKPEFAFHNQKLWSTVNNEDVNDSHVCEVHSLSPSSASLLAAHLDFDFPGKLETQKRVLATSPNKNAVVIWVSIGKFNILLGSDLEESGVIDRGWSAIVNSDEKPKGKASFYKIPHHGSKNAHHQEVWDTMLNGNPIAVLTPFNKRVPSQNDIQRLCSLSRDVFSTALLKSNTRIKRDTAVEKQIKQTVNRITCNTSIGQVRLRILKTGETNITLFGDAFQLSCS